MKKLLSFFLAAGILQIGFCQNTKPYWQQQVNYKIDVTLNDADHFLDGYVKMEYFNNSPDTLRFIWIHLWPNAYKNDRTAFSDQLLENGRTDFYFSDIEKRGYINRLDFKVNGNVVKILDHPQHQDIIQLVLTEPILPHSSAKIETPFHEKLPFNFSRGGHVGQAYQITQWYPKPAVYDAKGWHPISYLDQGEFYSEFGNYEVQISLPANYIVAATGELQPGEPVYTELATKPEPVKKKNTTTVKKKTGEVFPPSENRLKTIRYKQNNIHDFAWFADKRFIVKEGEATLQSGKKVKLYSYSLPSATNYWKNSIDYLKQAVETRSEWLGEYPYAVASAVEAKMGFEGGMEYPTITSISPSKSAADLEGTIEHEVGHNWNYGILASNERQHPWMDEGINSFYDKRYRETKQINKTAETAKEKNPLTKKLPVSVYDLLFQSLVNRKADQPIETSSAAFTEINYNIVGYGKTAEWMSKLEKNIGKNLFDSCMHEFYNRWKFKHPYPADFKNVIEEVSGKNMDEHFALLNKKGNLEKIRFKKDIRLTAFFNLKEPEKHHYIGIAPAIGYNYYDRLMVGAVIHNYTLPIPAFHFVAVPLYATSSKQLNGLARIGYTKYTDNKVKKIDATIAFARFSSLQGTDSSRNKIHGGFYKIAPAVRFTFKNKSPRSLMDKWIEWKTYFIGEKGFDYVLKKSDSVYYPTTQKYTTRYINQLTINIANDRVLYPYQAQLQIQQGEGFARAAFTGNYFFNYAKGSGLNVRLFAGKFFYLGDKTTAKQYETAPYHLNMTGPKGDEDYTYSNYFLGRNEFEKTASQQIMERDGFFKVRTDYLSNKIGKTDNWLIASNLTTDIPKAINPLQLLPVKIPLKIFFDIGTYAEAWDKDATTGRFIYDAGIQLSLFHNVLNIYAPILYSKVYRDYFKSTITEKRFQKNIVFTINFHQLSLKNLSPKIPF